MNNMKITAEDIGMRVWSNEKQDYGIIEEVAAAKDRPVSVNFKTERDRYTCGGCAFSQYPGQDLYWDKPTITAPDKPKRMVEKTRWVVLVGDDDMDIDVYEFEREESANGFVLGTSHAYVSKAVPITIEVPSE